MAEISFESSNFEGQQRAKFAAVGIVGAVCFGTLGALFAQGRAGQVACWTLAANRITASNEVGEPQVNVKQGVVKRFANGSKVELAPHSMLVLSWLVEDSAF